MNTLLKFEISTESSINVSGSLFERFKSEGLAGEFTLYVTVVEGTNSHNFPITNEDFIDGAMRLELVKGEEFRLKCDGVANFDDEDCDKKLRSALKKGTLPVKLGYISLKPSGGFMFDNPVAYFDAKDVVGNCSAA